MLSKPQTCEGCSLATLGEGFSQPTGSGYYGVMLIGEALGEKEAAVGKPFVGPAGQQLQECIDWAGLDRDGFTITNVVWCRPPDNKLEGEPYAAGAIEHCKREHLGPLVARVKPRVLVPLGNVPLQAILGLSQITKARGYVYRQGDMLVLPSIHPSFIQRGQTKWIQVLVHDLQRAVELAKTGWLSPPTHYLLDPPPEQALAWVRRAITSGAPIAYDIETPDKKDEEDEQETGERKPKPIIRIGFSAGEYTALSIPFSKKYHQAIREALESPNEKIVHNGSFDNPRLHDAGFDIKGTIHDSMVAWHILHSDLPKSLGFIATMLCPEQPPWKHLSHDLPSYYNATDADVTWRIFHRTVQWLQTTGLWPVYERHVLQLDKILALMTSAGMPIDPEIRKEKAAELTTKLESIDAQIQLIVPIEVHPHHPKEGYKARPPKDTPLIDLPNGRKAKLLPFVPSSGKNGGIKRYQNFLGQVPIIRHGKETADETALNALCLRYPEDKLYPILLERREVEKLGSTYIGWLQPSGTVVGGIRVGQDARAHPTFTHNPSTLRTSCVGPNLQQIPRAKGLGSMVKEIFVAPPGFEFGELDYAAIEAVLVGYFADAPSYMRIARLGIHDFVNSYALAELDHVLLPSDLPSLDWSDATLAAFLGDLKARFPHERQARKHLVHARNYRVGSKRAQELLLKELGSTIPVKEIKKFFTFYDELFPEIGRWHRRLCGIVGGVGDKTPIANKESRRGDRGSQESDGGLLLGLRLGTEAGDRGDGGDIGTPPNPPQWSAGAGWIRNPYGYLHRYNRAVAWENIGGKWEWKFGVDANRLIAFLPQSTAAGIIKEAMLRAAEHPEILAALRLMVHDSLLIEAPSGRVETLARILQDIMQQPNPELGGLSIGVETKRGKTWLMKD